MVADRTKKRSPLPVLITVLTVVAAVAVGIRMTEPNRKELEALRQELQTISIENEALTAEVQGLQAAVAQQSALPQAIEEQKAEGFRQLSALERQIKAGESDRKIAYLTFDDGPRRGTTTRLLDGLRERGANATFFLVGERLAGNEDLVLRMQAEGHQVGTHTWSHIRLDGTAPAAQLRDIQAAQNAVCKLLDTDSCWLRPPYGLIDPAVRTGVTVPMVHWSVDPRDWESRDTAKVVRSVLKDVQPGDIILLHDIYPSSVEAALQIVDALEAEGYWFVTVEELLELNGIQPQAGAMYRSGRT